MHFIGNRAILLNNANGPIVYSSTFTAVSFFLPILVLLGAFNLMATSAHASYILITVSGILVGAAVCGMHYLGQLGIVNYSCRYQVGHVIGAALNAMVASVVALGIFFRLQETWSNSWWKRSLCAVVLAGAVSGMHWLATVGTTYRSVTMGPSQAQGTSRMPTVLVCTVLVSLASMFPYPSTDTSSHCPRAFCCSDSASSQA